jgi:hypothetical protein
VEVTDGRCRCPRCNAFREQHPCPDDSEIVWQVVVAVAEKIKEKFPGKFIATTLVYPPKMQMPKTVKIPDNVRVRICTSGPKEVATPNRLESDLELIRNLGRPGRRRKSAAPGISVHGLCPPPAWSAGDPPPFDRRIPPQNQTLGSRHVSGNARPDLHLSTGWTPTCPSDA